MQLHKSYSHSKSLIVGLFSICFVAFSLILAGCGSSPAGSQSSSQPNITGNWGLQGQSTTFTGVTFLVGGPLTVTDSTVTGTFEITRLLNSSCFTPLVGEGYNPTPIAVSGTYQNGKLQVSGADNGSTITMSGQVSSSNTLSNGKYSISGVTACTDSGTVSGSLQTPLSGTYSGSLLSEAVTVTLTQTTTADSNGLYHLTGTLQSPGNSCIPSGMNITAANSAGDTWLAGSEFVAIFTDTNPNDPDGQVLLEGTFDAAASTLTINPVASYLGTCLVQTGSGTLTKS